jgi:uncharacterized protein YjbI with pentapeptide repeats
MKAETESSSAPNPEEPPKTSRISRWVGAIAAVALLLGIIGVILFYGYQARPGWVGVADKKFWDYLELLIVPAALAIGVYLLNWAQSDREREAEEAQQERERRAEEARRERERVAEEARRERERVAEEARRERELEVESQRAQDEALQAYLDQMSQLLIDKDRPLHRSPRGDRLRTVARARTLTVLPRLDGDRKARVVQFLYESDLLTKNRPIVAMHGADLSGADLRGANLREADLREADLRRADLFRAELRGADLSGADLRGANLGERRSTFSWTGPSIVTWHTYLSGANLSRADLREANLRRVNLHEANLSRALLSKADLRGANLGGGWLIGAADLSGANLGGALLSGANLGGALLSEAYLSGAEGIANEELAQQTSSLEGATMPNGQKYEDWLKSKGREDDGENRSPS